MQAEGRAGRVGGEGAEPGSPEVAVAARQFRPLGQFFARLERVEGRSDKAGYYERGGASQEVPDMKTVHFPIVLKLPETGSNYAFGRSVASACNAC